MPKLLVQLVSTVFMSEKEWLRNKKPSWSIKAVGKSGKSWTVHTAAEARYKLHIGLLIDSDELMAVDFFEISAGPAPPTGAKQTLNAQLIRTNHISELNQGSGVLSITARQYKRSVVKAPENRTVIGKEEPSKESPVQVTEVLKLEAMPTPSLPSNLQEVMDLINKNVTIKEIPVAKKIEVLAPKTKSEEPKATKFVFVHELSERLRNKDSVKTPPLQVRLIKGAPKKGSTEEHVTLIRFVLNKDIAQLLGWKDQDLFVIGIDPYTGDGVIRRASSNNKAFKLKLTKNNATLFCGLHPELGVQPFEGDKTCSIQTSLSMTGEAGCVEELTFSLPKEIMLVNAK